MIHENIYSNRIKNIKRCEPYTYEINNEFKYDSFTMLLAKYKEEHFLKQAIVDYCETKRVYISKCAKEYILYQYNYNYTDIIYDLRKFISTSKTEDVLDFFDIIVAILNNEIKEYEDDYRSHLILQSEKKEFIEHLNHTFKHNNLGFEVVNDVIATKNSDFLHEEVIVKPLTLLVNENFNGPVEEFKKAISYYTKSDYENAVIEACKAFESTMKSILDKLGVIYKKDKSNASQLIQLLEDNNIFDSFLDNMYKNLKSILTSGLPSIRNKKSGHGDGMDVNEVKRSYASYALNLAGSSIVFLLDRYYEKSKSL